MLRLRKHRLVRWGDGLMQAFDQDEAIADALLLHIPKAVFNKWKSTRRQTPLITFLPCGYLVETKQSPSPTRHANAKVEHSESLVLTPFARAFDTFVKARHGLVGASNLHLSKIRHAAFTVLIGTFG